MCDKCLDLKWDFFLNYITSMNKASHNNLDSIAIAKIDIHMI